jgi:hypothetical protein
LSIKSNDERICFTATTKKGTQNARNKTLQTVEKSICIAFAGSEKIEVARRKYRGGKESNAHNESETVALNPRQLTCFGGSLPPLPREKQIIKKLFKKKRKKGKKKKNNWKNKFEKKDCSTDVK